jgi:putative membrane protein
MMDGWYDGQWGVGGWIVMGLVMLLFWGVVVAVAVTLFRRRPESGGTPTSRHEDAERILSERFARGEIDEEEFTARRAALRPPE